MANDQNNGGSRWFRLGPVEYFAVAAVLAFAGTFFTKMNDKIESLAQTVPLLLEKQTAQGKDIDGLKADVKDLTKELSSIRIREAEERGRQDAASKGK